VAGAVVAKLLLQVRKAQAVAGLTRTTLAVVRQHRKASLAVTQALAVQLVARAAVAQRQ
jgi:hypothetical protein